MDTAVIDTTWDRIPAPKRWAANEYLRLAEAGLLEGENVELLDGEIVEKMSPIGVRHSECVTRLFKWLGRVVPETMDVMCQGTTRASDWSVPEPDLAVVKKPLNEFSTYPEAVEIALAIEVADSSLGLDRTRKARIYGAAGIPEYWILNLRDRVVEVHREPSVDGYGFIKRYDPQSLVRPLFLDVEVMVADLLPKAKR